MIVGNYFNKAICKNQKMADRLYLYYAEMKDAVQEVKEQKVIEQAKSIFKVYEGSLEGMNCAIVTAFIENRYIIDFVTEFEHLRVEVDVMVLRNAASYKLEN